MAEFIALPSFVVAVVALAAEGLKIAEGLAAFADRVATAKDELVALAGDVKFICRTLDDLAHSLKVHQHPRYIKIDWFQDTLQHADECRTVFKQVDHLLTSFTTKPSPSGQDALGKRSQIRFAFSESQVARLQRSLNGLQVKFTLRLAVFRFTVDAADRQAQAKRDHRDRHLAQLRRDQAMLELRIAHINLKDIYSEGSHMDPDDDSLIVADLVDPAPRLSVVASNSQPPDKAAATATPTSSVIPPGSRQEQIAPVESQHHIRMSDLYDPNADSGIGRSILTNLETSTEASMLDTHEDAPRIMHPTSSDGKIPVSNKKNGDAYPPSDTLHDVSAKPNEESSHTAHIPRLERARVAHSESVFLKDKASRQDPLAVANSGNSDRRQSNASNGLRSPSPSSQSGPKPGLMRRLLPDARPLEMQTKLFERGSRYETWIIRRNESYSKLRLLNKAWTKARIEKLPLSLDSDPTLGIESDESSTEQSLTRMPFAAREQVSSLLKQTTNSTLYKIFLQPSSSPKSSIRSIYIVVKQSDGNRTDRELENTSNSDQSVGLRPSENEADNTTLGPDALGAAIIPSSRLVPYGYDYDSHGGGREKKKHGVAVSMSPRGGQELAQTPVPKPQAGRERSYSNAMPPQRNDDTQDSISERCRSRRSRSSSGTRSRDRHRGMGRNGPGSDNEEHAEGRGQALVVHRHGNNNDDSNSVSGSGSGSGSESRSRMGSSEASRDHSQVREQARDPPLEPAGDGGPQREQREGSVRTTRQPDTATALGTMSCTYR
ncbi:uncharacterized protein HMPREF1541_08096 [Cyphellophora europaea CBS 101466]|uniref:Fungal N-terminal domain-containing protein n=1 Tax=Cyphellophora europaea (strain CBS 101466) TaxID=1220924 RepID=W2RKU3_CYPE1|nr:uncharacterized protein HMPREF1541_08096 [Cyphellophora europaea CBS 101466]ETN37106.1 hypothetical protein HMPREF1541_08096 [Cyphellophora europaea CBS 101466]